MRKDCWNLFLEPTEEGYWHHISFWGGRECTRNYTYKQSNRRAACTRFWVLNWGRQKIIKIFHHNQAPQPGNMWHKRSGSIASCISCWTYCFFWWGDQRYYYRVRSLKTKTMCNKIGFLPQNLIINELRMRRNYVNVHALLTETNMSYLSMDTSHFAIFISI